MRSASEYIAELAANGQHHFTTEQAQSAIKGSLVAVRASLRRLKAKGHIASPYRGFQVIVPPEYRRLGCLPAEQFVPQLMAHLGENHYYAALLSAAEFHGAAHQRPQVFQVMLAMNRRPIACGAVRVEFVARKDLDRTPVIERNTPRGTIRVSSPEATALELVGYADRCGGLDNVAGVLSELADAVDPGQLARAAGLCPVAWIQRLGYLLDIVDQSSLADALLEQVDGRAACVAPLVRAVPSTGALRDERWKLAINVSVEPES